MNRPRKWMALKHITETLPSAQNPGRRRGNPAEARSVGRTDE